MDELMRDRFLELVYDLLKDDDSNQRANAIINCADEYAESMKQQWIPVTEKLPEEYGEYLVTKHTIGWNCEEYDVIDIAYFDGDGFHKADRVIAWMPLPEPYQGGGE